MSSNRYSIALATLLTIALSAAHLSAGFIAYNAAAGTNGTQNWSGPLGMDFNVNEGFEIEVTHLGCFDSAGDGLAAGYLDYVITLYRRDQAGTPDDVNDDTGAGVLAQKTFVPGLTGDLIGAHRFLALDTPITLEPGAYTIVGEYFWDDEKNLNSSDEKILDDGGGALSFVGSGRYDTVSNVFPTKLDGGPVNRYGAGSFMYNVVPEPAACGLLVLGAVALRRRRSERRPIAPSPARP